MAGKAGANIKWRTLVFRTPLPLCQSPHLMTRGFLFMPIQHIPRVPVTRTVDSVPKVSYSTTRQPRPVYPRGSSLPSFLRRVVDWRPTGYVVALLDATFFLHREWSTEPVCYSACVSCLGKRDRVAHLWLRNTAVYGCEDQRSCSWHS